MPCGFTKQWWQGKKYWLLLQGIILAGVTVIMLATGPMAHGFKPSQERWIFMDEKIFITTAFGGEVKP
jgi:hypothetical protein